MIGLVILRLGIGWQLLYEGLWKIDTLSSSTPWTSEGYLKNSQGPMRDVFRSLTGDPDEMGWLDETAVLAQWEDWKQRFIRHYQLDEGQVNRLTVLIDGSSAFAASLDALPEGVDLAAVKAEKQQVVTYDAGRKQLRADGKLHMLATEKEALLEQVADKSGPQYDAYRTALDELFARSNRLSYRERLQAHLTGNPDNAGRVDGRISQIQLYNEMVGRYEQKLTSAKLPFEQDHLTRTWSDTRAKATELAGPVKALDAELKASAVEDILSVDQVKRGPLPQPWTALRVIDALTIAGLTGLGILLIVGLFTRFAAASAAFMVFGFYMAMPPLPGLPEVAGPEHSLIVNKNLIEVFALIALAFLPTGYWFGLDKLVGRFCCRKRKC